jgi:hypothetical protein
MSPVSLASVASVGNFARRSLSLYRFQSLSGVNTLVSLSSAQVFILKIFLTFLKHPTRIFRTQCRIQPTLPTNEQLPRRQSKCAQSSWPKRPPSPSRPLGSASFSTISVHCTLRSVQWNHSPIPPLIPFTILCHVCRQIPVNLAQIGPPNLRSCTTRRSKWNIQYVQN